MRQAYRLITKKTNYSCGSNIDLGIFFSLMVLLLYHITEISCRAIIVMKETINICLFYTYTKMD